MKIKEEFLDVNIGDPLTRKEILVRFIPIELYDYYFNNGYSILFEEEIPQEEITKTKTKNDI